jgi:hypothetical protein
VAKKNKKKKTGRSKSGSRPVRRSAKREGGKRVAGSRKRTAKVARSRNAARAAAARTTKRTRGRKAPAKPSTAAKARATVTGALKGAVAAVTKRLPGTDIDAITLLENDHRRLEDLLAQGEETGAGAGKTRKALLDTVAAALTVHETIEERLLYPALQRYPEAHAIVLEGFQEHHVADLIVKELYDTSTSAEEWGAKFKVLKENIEHHIQEEEGPMFRTARGVMSRDELVELGKQMAAMKADAERGRL